MRVLLIEDNGDDIVLLRELLAQDEDAPVDLCVARSLGEGIARLADGGIDVVLLDLSLPGSLGLQTLDRVLAIGSDVPVIVLSGTGDTQTALEAVQRGAQDYLVKGHFGQFLLQRAIRYAAERQQLDVRLRRLNAILRAIRNIDQLIVHEHDPDRLVQATCEELVYTRGFDHAWIVRTETETAPTVAAAGCAPHRVAQLQQGLAQDSWPACARRALAPELPQIVEVDQQLCDMCPFECGGPCTQSCAVALPLVHQGIAYGVLGAGLPATLQLTREERSLLHEVAGDVGFALAQIALRKHHQEAEAEEKRLRAQLLQCQKLESIGTLAGGVAHEINNPIMGIMNYAQLILDETRISESVHEFAGEIITETKRVARTVRNLLMFARQDKQGHSPARMVDIVAQTQSLIQTVMRHDQILLEVDVPEDLPRVTCRSQQIQQVLMNLLTNARDALNERFDGYDAAKVIRVRAQHIEDGKGNWVRTTVEDHGNGIAEHIRERMFDPFFTTKALHVGTGLGLSITHGIVRDHAGRLTIESEPQEYTRFHVDLPVAEHDCP